MRMLTFSVLKNCKLKSLYFRIPRHVSSNAVPADVDLAKATGDAGLLEFSPSWPADEERALRAAVARDMRVLPEFVSAAEERALLDELEPILKRMRYEFDHWDNAIEGYRETERATWGPAGAAVVARVRSAAFADEEPLPHVHVLDLAAAGHIKPHVDAVRFCGGVIAGVCLASGAVMRLQHTSRPHLALDALLPARALYIMRGCARYDFTHAVLGGERSVWRGAPLPKGRRVALICRAKPTAVLP